MTFVYFLETLKDGEGMIALLVNLTGHLQVVCDSLLT